jgi:nitrous oxide reductase
MSVPLIDTPTETEMMAIKRRLLIATTAVLALCGFAGGAAMLPSRAVPTIAHGAEQSSALHVQLPAVSPYDAGFVAVAHPSQDAWVAVFRATSR